jgi:hypothetical protein
MTNLLVSKATIYGLIPVGRVVRDSTEVLTPAIAGREPQCIRAKPREISGVLRMQASGQPTPSASTGPISSEGSGRECDTRIAHQSGPRRGTPRSRQAPDVCALLRQSSAPTNTQARPDKAGNAGDDARCLKSGGHRRGRGGPPSLSSVSASATDRSTDRT